MDQQSASHQVFHVNLRGVVELLSTALYSSPRVFVRELIQNAFDAITARRDLDPSYQTFGIRIAVDGRTLSITDDGIGLTADQIETFLATVGSSSKRDLLDMPRRDFLGQFGIGLLSAFLVTDVIELTTRSAAGGPGLRWLGRSDGTYTVTLLDGDVPAGTTVTLTARADDSGLVLASAVRASIERYACYLPVQIRFVTPGDEAVLNKEAVFLKPLSEESAAEQVAWATAHLGSQPFGVLEIHVPETDTHGIAYVLSAPTPPSVRSTHTVYLGRMLVSDQVTDLLPPWAFFVRCVVTSTGLHPTASREQLLDDEALRTTREAIGAQLRTWLVDLANNPTAMATFVQIHHLALRALVVHEDELGPLVARMLPMSTSRGEWSLGELVSASPVLHFADSTDEFRQIVALVGPDELIINAGHTYDHEILSRLGSMFPGATARRLRPSDVIDRLRPVGDAEGVADFEVRASAVLVPFQAVAVTRVIEQSATPALLLTDPDVLRATERTKARRTAMGRWQQALDAMAEAATAEGEAVSARLVCNWENPFIQRLVRIDDEVVFARVIRLLYVQAILHSGRPLDRNESKVLTDSLTDLMDLSLASSEGPSL